MVGGHLAPFLYSSRERSELSQWLCYDDIDSTIDIVVVIIIIIIIIIIDMASTHGGSCVYLTCSWEREGAASFSMAL